MFFRVNSISTFKGKMSFEIRDGQGTTRWKSNKSSLLNFLKFLEFLLGVLAKGNWIKGSNLVIFINNRISLTMPLFIWLPMELGFPWLKSIYNQLFVWTCFLCILRWIQFDVGFSQIENRFQLQMKLKLNSCIQSSIRFQIYINILFFVYYYRFAFQWKLC